ncbi:hypothetical protein MLD63_16320 [Paracoccus sp. TK19116]|uniref:Uncharacterized protein n=1 Tax=Paracoccus albicereus TaxID=2922394 RepID=A0ABT1MWC0_9RHOB|nr:hypothetical protein [Paracoccus albicereus]MCQ0971989.1 hypothetical protein [Paracoccus albicereus]
MQGVSTLASSYFFEIASLLIASGALVYAALALRVAKEALEAARSSDLAALKSRAHEVRVGAERNFVSLQSACQEMRGRWDLHHERYSPKLGSPEFRNNDTRHILEVERKGHELLRLLKTELTKVAISEPAALEGYIHWAEQTAVEIERLKLQLSPPRQLFI